MASASTTEAEPSVLQDFHEQQKHVARLSIPEEARLIIDLGRTGVLSTIGSTKTTAGFPLGSVVEFAAGADGRPIFALSSLSGHTRDLRAEPRCSLTVAAPGFQGMAQARFTLAGSVTPVAEAEISAARDTFLAKNPNSFWVDFGDFTWFRMEESTEGRFNGGFARAATLSPAEYSNAQADPVAGFSAPIAVHMNEDHSDSTRAMVQHYTGLPAESATIVDVDRLGMNLTAVYDGSQIPVRLAYPRPADDRKSIKTLIVEMTRASAAAAAPSTED